MGRQYERPTNTNARVTYDNVEINGSANIKETDKKIWGGREYPKPPQTTQQKVQPKIINLSTLTLSQFHLKLLSHGTKFAPVTKGNYFDAKKCTEEFTRKIKNKFDYHDVNVIDVSK